MKKRLYLSLIALQLISGLLNHVLADGANIIIVRLKLLALPNSLYAVFHSPAIMCSTEINLKFYINIFKI
jgi:hypothetical protein